MSTGSTKQIVIIGGGIAGVATAYYLTRHPSYDSAKHHIVLIEADRIAGGASGKAGGFLASWATPKCLAPLSFRLHEELARELDGEENWGYRRVHAAEVKLQANAQGDIQRVPDTEASEGDGERPKETGWLRPDCVQDHVQVGTPADSAQAHPLLLTRALAVEAEKAGAKIVFNRSAKIEYDRDGKNVKAVSYMERGEQRTIPTTDVVVAAGPWTTGFLPSIELLTPKGHSVVVKTAKDLTPHILFANTETHSGPDAKLLLDDIYPRPPDALHGYDTAYSSGPDYYDAPLPKGTAEVKLEEAKLEEVWAAISAVSQEIAYGHIVTRQACYKAQIRMHKDGDEVGPIIGPMETTGGLWVATGFDEWGIQNGPGAGLVLSEMIMDGKASSADVEQLLPKHYIH